MVTFLPKVESTGEYIGNALGGGLQQGISEGFKEKSNSKRENQIVESLKSATGIDTSGWDPELRKEFVSKLLQGQNKQSELSQSLKNQKELETHKLQGKQQLQNEKQSYLDRLFGSESQKSQPFSNESDNESSSFNPRNVSDEDILRASAIDPVLGKELRAAKDTALREKRSQRDFEAKQKEKTPEREREKHLTSAQATSDVKYNNELQSAHKQHEIKSQTLDRLEQLNKKGVTGKPYEKLLERWGLVNQTSEGRREFAADVKNLITDIRSILGGQFSQFEFQTILNAYPSADFSQGANEAIIKNLKEFQDIRNQEFKIAKNLKSENGGKLPEDFQSRVNDRLQEYAQSKLNSIKSNSQEIMREQLGLPKGFTVLLAPDGEPIGVPNEKVDEVLSMGAQLP